MQDRAKLHRTNPLSSQMDTACIGTEKDGSVKFGSMGTTGQIMAALAMTGACMGSLRCVHSWVNTHNLAC